ncbi:hypothetical protein FBU30_011094, partial [Linnemannia zychae]
VMAQGPTSTSGAEAFEVIHTEEFNGGIVTLYGDSDANAGASVPESRSMRLNKRCGENHVICYDSHRAQGCDNLINYPQNNSGNTMPGSPRAICFYISPTG